MTCKYCGKSFQGRKKMYCSKECCRAADRDRKRDNYVWITPRAEKCLQCGKSIPGRRAKFCSRECGTLYNRIKSGATHHSEILTKTCPICGKTFETWKSQKLTCSERCSKIRRWRIGDNQGIIFDYGISLQKVADRDNNICQICGKPVDWNDWSGKKSSGFIAGDNYPSIDHIVPRSKGGLHKWDNVQLAHKKCNSLKSNKTG